MKIMKKLLTLLGVGIILMSFPTDVFAISDESSSLDPLAQSTQQCSQFPNFGTQINFEGWSQTAPWTVIDVQYLGQGVLFGTAAGGNPTVARTNTARPLDNLILACDGPGGPFSGDIHAKFMIGGGKGYVTEVGATVGWCDNVGAVTMEAYNCDGALVGSYTNTIIGVEFFSISASEIHKVIFFMGDDPAGSDIDCFTYDQVRPCEQLPTVSQWGLILLILAIVGFSVYMIRRRKVRIT